MEGMKEFEKIINSAKKQMNDLSQGFERAELEGVIFPAQNTRGIQCIIQQDEGCVVYFTSGLNVKFEKISKEEAEKALCPK